MRVAGLRQRQGDMEGPPLTNRAIDRDRALHAFDNAPRDGEPKPRAAVPPAGAAVALLEFLEQRRNALRRDARPRVVHGESDLSGRAALDRNPDAARPGEFDRVPGQIDENLPEPVLVAHDPARYVGRHEGGNLDALALSGRGEKLLDALDKVMKVERFDVELEPPRF